MKSQSAMEYLMTYGWAILVIAVVLAALYSLGIFNPSTFAPKASAGSCEVVRPFGPTTTTDIHLEGTCTNMLPKYVASFDGSSIIYSNISEMPYGSSPVTVTGWFYYTPSMPVPSMLWSYGISGNCGAGNYFSLRYLQGSGNPNNTFTTDPWCDQVATIVTPKPGIWYFIAETANKSDFGIYVSLNGKIYSNTGGVPANIKPSEYFYIAKGNDGGNFVGSISDLQIYNTTLSKNQINALYQEGIGGDPIDLTHLVAWYPLNGNANDYSGNDYNGKGVDVGYSPTWYRTYSAP